MWFCTIWVLQETTQTYIKRQIITGDKWKMSGTDHQGRGTSEEGVSFTKLDNQARLCRGLGTWIMEIWLRNAEEEEDISKKVWQKPRGGTHAGCLRDTEQNNVTGTEGRSEVEASCRNVLGRKGGKKSLLENVQGLGWFAHWHKHCW